MSESTAPTEPNVETPEVEVPGATPETEPLGETGIAALKSEREARKAAEKAAADALAKIKKIEDRDKSEAQKQQEALAEAQAQLAELAVAKTRAEVAAAKGVPADLLRGGTQEELEASADALIAFKGEPQPQRLHIPNEGQSPTNTSNPSTEFAEFLTNQLGQQPA